MSISLDAAMLKALRALIREEVAAATVKTNPPRHVNTMEGELLETIRQLNKTIKALRAELAAARVEGGKSYAESRAS